MSDADGVHDAPLAFYNRALIDLAADIDADCPLPQATHSATARSPICGSVVTVTLTLDEQKRIVAFGYALEACTLTKAVIAVMRAAIIGAGREEIIQAHSALRLLLMGDAAAAHAAWPNDRWRKMAVLAALKDYPARHSAVQLPFEAVEKALADHAAHHMG